MRTVIRLKDSRMRIAWLLLAVSLLISAVRFSMPQRADAYSDVLYQYTVKVKSGYLALRKGQKFARENEIGELYSGDKVIACPLKGEKNGYIYVYSPKLKKLGYVNKSYLTDRREYEEEPLYAEVEHGYLALRSAKAFDKSNETGKLYTGDPVIVLENGDDELYWTVYAPELGRAGYVNSDYLVYDYDEDLYLYSESYQEPEVVPVEVVASGSSADWYWENDKSDTLYFRVEATNYSEEKTVKSFEITCFALDSHGKRIYGDPAEYTLTTKQKIRPGETGDSDFIKLPDRHRIDRVYAAVSKVTFTDGSTIEYDSIPEDSYGVWEIE